MKNIIILLLCCTFSSCKVLKENGIVKINIIKTFNQDNNNRICSNVKFVIIETSSDLKLYTSLICIDNKYCFSYMDANDKICLQKGKYRLSVNHIMYKNFVYKNLIIDDPQYDYLIKIELDPKTEPLY
ncbi:MAG: hypothetical protein WBP45_07220 [Daejeonella sp.]